MNHHHGYRQYLPIYKQYFSAFKGLRTVFYEIGTTPSDLKSWKEFFGPYSVVVGIDRQVADPSEYGPETYIRIGRQEDAEFLSKVLEEFGPPNVVLDDASHQVEETLRSFSFLFPRMAMGSIYMIEDLHQNLAEFIQQVFVRWEGRYGGCLWPSFIHSISLYNSVAVVERGNPEALEAV